LDTSDSQIDKIVYEVTLAGSLGPVHPRAQTLDYPAGENVMPPHDDCPDDDSFERALREYRERNWCPDEFADLPTDVQCDIIERACRIQAANDRLKELIQAA